MNRRVRVAAGAGLSLGAVLGVPAAAEAEDITVTNLNNSGGGSLRDAIEDANLDADNDRILFASSLSGTIELLSNINVDSPVEILGPGARTLTVDGSEAGRVFVTFPGTGEEATISDLTLRGGNGGFAYGGVVFHGNGELTISRSTLTGGQATTGGGLYIQSIADSTQIFESTITGNTAANNGGGFYNPGLPIEVRNSTISGNEAGNNGGGGYVGAMDSSDGLVANSTITGNQADIGGGLHEGLDGATLRGSIIAGNTASNPTPDLEGGEWPASFSLIGDVGDAEIVDDGGNLLNVNPDLLGLANNGGPTDTHALAKGSPAINAGPSDAPGSDQRGAPRKGQPDIGAYEFAKCAGVLVNVVGTEGKDKLKGTSAKDGILGLKGKDKLSGKGKKDGLCGAGGKDKLKGGGGKDKLKGGPGKDKLIGGPGKDKLVGGPGKDKEIQ